MVEKDHQHKLQRVWTSTGVTGVLDAATKQTLHKDTPFYTSRALAQVLVADCCCIRHFNGTHAGLGHLQLALEVLQILYLARHICMWWSFCNSTVWVVVAVVMAAAGVSYSCKHDHLKMVYTYSHTEVSRKFTSREFTACMVPVWPTTMCIGP